VDDISSAILSAWAVVGPRILGDPMELAKRLARRRLKTLRRPLRAWCLAVRASDNRINPATAACSPEDAAYPYEADVHWRYHPHDEHQVVLTAKLLRQICRAVRIVPWEDWKVVARKLGVTKGALRNAINRGLFQVHYYPGLGGQIGKPIPTLYTPHSLDPSSGHIAEPPDEVWCGVWQHVADLIPRDFEQPVTRVPWNMTMRRTKRGPRQVFRGWRWVCPACKRKVRIVFLPVMPKNLPEMFGLKLSRDEWDQLEPPPMTFACARCHGVRTYSRADKNSWNELVHHLSGGLLYGFEVEQPAWLKGRKRAYAPLPGRKPSKRCEEVLDRLLRGWRDRQIAKDLGISFHRARNLVARVLKQNHAHGRKELIRMLRPKNPATDGAPINTDDSRAAEPQSLQRKR
jgi:DNA-binding CsgD family transcriptional regulator